MWRVTPAEGGRPLALGVTEDKQQSVHTTRKKARDARPPQTKHTRHKRGGQGLIAVQTSDRNGKVVAATLVDPSDEIMLITTGGVLIRTRVSEIREMGRTTQGVTLINLDKGERLTGLQRVAEAEVEEMDAAEDSQDSDEV